MLNLVWVRTFKALIECKTFQGAAEQLGLAQPTVSQHIQKLEEQLGAALFIRSRAGCEPTREALSFLSYAEGLLRINDRAIASVTRDFVRVGASSNIGIYLLQPYVSSYLNGRGASDFDLIIDRNPAIANMLESREVDVGVMEWWDNRPGFGSAPWRYEEVVVIAPPGHPLASEAAVTKQDLSRYQLLGGEPGTGTGRLLAKYFGDEAPLPKVSMQLGSTEAVKQAVAAGIGVSLVLASAVQTEVSAGKLVAIRFKGEPLQKELFVVWRDRDRYARPRQDFVTHLLGAPIATSEARSGEDALTSVPA